MRALFRTEEPASQGAGMVAVVGVLTANNRHAPAAHTTAAPHGSCTGKQQAPGVYLASSTALCNDAAVPQSAKLGSSNSPSPAGMAAQLPPHHQATSIVKARATAAAAPPAASVGHTAGGSCARASASRRSGQLDVYGQPRLTTPPLPATYSKVCSSAARLQRGRTTTSHKCKVCCGSTTALANACGPCALCAARSRKQPPP